MPVLRSALPLLVSAALISFVPGLALAQSCEERLTQTEERYKAIELSPGRRAEVRQVVEQAREMARSGKQEECLRATRHLEFALTSLEDLRSGEQQASESPQKARAQSRAGPTAAASAKERLRAIQAARETALAESLGREEQAGSDAAGGGRPQGEEELTAALARVREDLAREPGGAAQSAPEQGAGPAPPQQARADGTMDAQPLDQEQGAPPQQAKAGTPATDHGSGPCGESIEVGSGDTLYAIARRCRTTVDALMEANQEINDPTLIRVGQTVRVPAGAGGGGGQEAAAEARSAGSRQLSPSGPDAARLEQAGAERDAQVALMRAQAAVRSAGEQGAEQQEAGTAADEPSAAATPAQGRSAGPCEESIEVGSGDTLYGIARRCGTTVDAILKANPEIKDPARIRVGQKIALPAG